jgi:hypothetical protein
MRNPLQAPSSSSKGRQLVALFHHAPHFISRGLVGGWLLLPIALSAQAQVRYDIAKARYDSARRATQPRMILKAAPLTLFELQNTAELGIEVRLTEQFSLQGQFGYAPNWLLWRSLPDRYTRRENWRGRLEARWYIDRPNANGLFPIGRYVGIDLLYKQLNAYEAATIGKECQGFGCAYYQRTNSRVVRYIGAINGKVGTQRVIGYSDKTNQPLWLLDGYVGLGVRFGQTERQATETGDLYFDPGTSFDFTDPFRQSNRAYLNVVAGVKVGYVLK